MMYSQIQKQILQKLLSKYESSKTYRGKNEVSQTFSIKPAEIFKDYDRDSADINKISDFEREVFELESDNLVSITKKYERIAKITANASDECWNKIRSILCVKDKKERLGEEINFYSRYLNSHKIVSLFCKSQIERLKSGKESSYEIPEAEILINLLNFILSNNEEILERELSIAVLHDSKLWEKKYKAKVIRLLKDSGNYSDLISNLDEKEVSKAILEYHNIFDNPTYVYFKGDGKIKFSDGHILTVNIKNPVAISSSSLNDIDSIQVQNSNVITVENITSFNRVQDENCFYIFLSGYHNSAKQKFLKKIYEQNSGKSYFHFGDLDPDGFLIFENLKTKTGIPFQIYKMSLAELNKYSEYSKPLEQNDKIKACRLIERNLFTCEMKFMLDNNCKIEQEIISWLENRVT